MRTNMRRRKAIIRTGTKTGKRTIRMRRKEKRSQVWCTIGIMPIRIRKFPSKMGTRTGRRTQKYVT